MPNLLRGIVAALLLAAATVLAGWWSVPLVAGLGGWVISPRKGDAWRVALAGAAAWGALLAWTAATGPLAKLLHQLSSLMHLPGWSLIAVTLVFPAGLAWSAWTLGREVRAIGS
jgi:hypothetical protein